MPAAWMRFRQGVCRDRLRVQRAFNSSQSRRLKCIRAGVISALGVLWIVWAVVEDVEAPQAPLPDNILYYALSTIAQSAAALAAILGAFGLWRLGHIRELDHALEGRERQARSQHTTARAQREYAQEKEDVDAVATEGEQSLPSPAARDELQLEIRLTYIGARRLFIMDEWKWLTKYLRVFLLGTLAILALAIVGLAFVNTLCAWVCTMRTGIILASLILAIGPAMVIWRAVSQSRPGTLVAVLLLVLIGALPAEAAGRQPEVLWLPQRCTTHEEPTLNRLITLCDDGTRAVSTWSPTLQRWQTTITASPRPGRTCTPHTSGGGLEVRCR